MIISNDIESFIKTKGKEECSNLNIVREEAIVYWHHSDMNNYEAAQREDESNYLIYCKGDDN